MRNIKKVICTIIASSLFISLGCDNNENNYTPPKDRYHIGDDTPSRTKSKPKQTKSTPKPSASSDALRYTKRECDPQSGSRCLAFTTKSGGTNWAFEGEARCGDNLKNCSLSEILTITEENGGKLVPKGTSLYVKDCYLLTNNCLCKVLDFNFKGQELYFNKSNIK